MANGAQSPPDGLALTIQSLDMRIAAQEKLNRELAQQLDRWKLIGSVATLAVAIVFGVPVWKLPETARSMAEDRVKTELPAVLAKDPDIIRDQLRVHVPALVSLDQLKDDASKNLLEIEKTKSAADLELEKIKTQLNTILTKDVRCRSIVVQAPEDNNGPRIVLTTNSKADPSDPTHSQAILQFVNADNRVVIELNAKRRENLGKLYLRGGDGEDKGVQIVGSDPKLDNAQKEPSPQEVPAVTAPAAAP